MMSRICRSEYVLRAKLPEYQRRVRTLRETLSREIDDRCYVSFSAGKDSAVLAHAAHQLRPGIPILMVDPGVPIHWTNDDRLTWLDYAQTQGWALKLFPWDKFRRQFPTEASAYRAQVHEDMFADLTGWTLSNGLTRRLVGLRAEESPERRKSLGRDRGASEARVCPLGLWTTADIWTYIIEQGLPWLSIYDHLGPDARNGLIGRNAIERGRLEYLRKFYPDAWRLANELFSQIA